MSNQPFQTRDNQGGLEHWSTLAEAMAFAKDNPDVWKISFNVGEERVRLVRVEDSFVYDPMDLYHPF